MERGPYLSYANCALPYHMFGIDARTNCKAIAISRKDKTVQLRDISTGE